MRNKLFTTLIAFSLTACQTVQDQSIPLPQNLQNSATRLEIPRPNWRLGDEAFHQNLGKFQIDSADIGWGKVQRTEQWASQSGGWLNGFELNDRFLNLVLLDLLQLRRSSQTQWHVRAERDFAFSLQAALSSPTTVKVRCRALSLSDQQQTTLYSGSAKGKELGQLTQNERKRQSLSCELKQAEMVWYLHSDTIANGDPVLTLKLADSPNDSNQAITINNVYDSIYLLNGQWQSNPVRFHKISGLSFQVPSATNSAMPAAALSLDGGKAKLWLGNTLTEPQSALLTAASYSVLMHDWLDGSWRNLFQH